VECFFRITEIERNARVERRPARGEGVTMLIARPTTLAAIFDALDELHGAHLLAGGTDFMVEVNSTGALPAAIRRATGLPLNRIPVRLNDIAPSAEPAASTS
jgi:xanthine dehydrogenase iron-sulfur cluster and FAD-binding subunit A